jgi:hypothetical protein
MVATFAGCSSPIAAGEGVITAKPSGQLPEFMVTGEAVCDERLAITLRFSIAYAFISDKGGKFKLQCHDWLGKLTCSAARSSESAI